MAMLPVCHSAQLRRSILWGSWRISTVSSTSKPVTEERLVTCHPFLIFFRLRVVCPKSFQARAFLAGDDVSNMGTMTDAPPKKKKGDAAGQSWDILSPSLTDPSRYRVDAANKKNVSRLLAVAFSTGGVPRNFAENYHFKLAMKTLQEVLVGSAPWKPPGRKDLAKMHPLESAAAVHDTSVWMASTRHLTLAARWPRAGSTSRC